jgi:hypothetical protein
MKFGQTYLKLIIPAMRNVLFILAVAVMISSCTASKDVTSDRQKAKMEKKLAQQNAIKQAVESRQYIIKAERLNTIWGGWAYLVPKFNYIIVDGDIVSVSLGYVGRSYGARPITGINFNGHTVKYDLTSNDSKGKYEVTMKVAKGSDTFTFYITISPSGSCSFSVLNQFIQSASYRGEVTPVLASKTVAPEKKEF